MVAEVEAKRSTVYGIRDRHGRVVAEHVRYDNADGTKQVLWRQTDGQSGLNGTPMCDLPLYGSEDVTRWPAEAPVIIVEGEGVRDALNDPDAGIYVLATLGTGHRPTADRLREVLGDREAILWPDGDDPGRKHMETLAGDLAGIAASVQMYTWHDAPQDVKGADAADHPAVVSGRPKALDWLLTDLLDAPRWQGVTPSQVPNKSVTPVTPIRFSEMGPPGPREFVVECIVPKGHATTIFGDGGSAKSILALSAGTAIAGGADTWMGRKIKSCPVLYVDFELDSDEQRRRAYQVARGVYLEKPPHDLLYVSGLGRSAGEVLKACLTVCGEYGVGVVIIDSLGIALEGDAEKAGDVIGFHHEYLDPFRAAGVTLLVVDHQGKTQTGERYQNKRTFGSVYKENLARSVLQVQPGDRGEGLLTVKIRQTKTNFGSKAEPFGARLTFSEEEITVTEHPLDSDELAEEETLNGGDRALLVLADGPAYPVDVAQKTAMPLGTVKNELTRLRKRGLIEYTGEVEPHTRAKEVRLTDDGGTVTASQSYKGAVTPVTPDHDNEKPWPHHPEGCACDDCSKRFRREAVTVPPEKKEGF